MIETRDLQASEGLSFSPNCCIQSSIGKVSRTFSTRCSAWMKHTHAHAFSPRAVLSDDAGGGAAAGGQGPRAVACLRWMMASVQWDCWQTGTTTNLRHTQPLTRPRACECGIFPDKMPSRGFQPTRTFTEQRGFNEDSLSVDSRLNGPPPTHTQHNTRPGRSVSTEIQVADQLIPTISASNSLLVEDVGGLRPLVQPRHLGPLRRPCRCLAVNLQRHGRVDEKSRFSAAHWQDHQAPATLPTLRINLQAEIVPFLKGLKFLDPGSTKNGIISS